MNIDKLRHKLRILIEAKGLSRREVASKSKVPYPSLSKFLAQDSDMQSSNLLKLLNALSVPLDRAINIEINHSIDSHIIDSGTVFNKLFDALPRSKKKLVVDTLIKSLSNKQRQELAIEIKSLKV